MNLDRGKVSSPVHTNGTFFVWSGNEYGIWTVQQIVFKSDILINELQVTSYELICLRVAFIARVASYDLFLWHELRVTFCIRVTSYCFLHKLRVTVYCTSYELLFAYELRVTVYYTSHELYFNYELH